MECATIPSPAPNKKIKNAIQRIRCMHGVGKQPLKLLVVMALCALPAKVFGNDSVSSQIEIAEARVADALIQLHEKSERCAEQRTVLPADAFDHLDIPTEHIKTALIYFHTRAENQCISLEAHKFVGAANVLERLLPMENEALDDLRYSDLVVESFLDEVEKEADYLQLPQPTREALEAIPVLRQPFELLESAKSIGLF